MSQLSRKRFRIRLYSDLFPLVGAVSKPMYLFSAVIILLPALLLCVLCAWKAILFPAALPPLAWWLFLPAYLLLGVVPPALVCALLTALPRSCSRSLWRVLLPALTYCLLLCDLYLLLLLYHAPYIFCVLSAAAMCVGSGLVAVFVRFLSRTLALLFGGTLLWNVLLFFLTLGFS